VKLLKSASEESFDQKFKDELFNSTTESGHRSKQMNQMQIIFTSN
jgi:hypothetical protein